MRFWISVPFIHRTRIGFSVSTQEIERAFAQKPLTAEEKARRAAEKRELDAYAKAVADRWAPVVADAIIIGAIAAVVAAIWLVLAMVW
jgi:hypothetical protein